MKKTILLLVIRTSGLPTIGRKPKTAAVASLRCVFAGDVAKVVVAAGGAGVALVPALAGSLSGGWSCEEYSFCS
jgi:hypothetical protein